MMIMKILAEIQEEKRGLHLVIALPKDHKMGLRAKVLGDGVSVGQQKLAAKNCVEKLME